MTTESGAQFSAALAALGHTQATFIRWLMEHGDPRGLTTLQRFVGRLARGEVSPSGEMLVLLKLMQAQQSQHGMP